MVLFELAIVPLGICILEDVMDTAIEATEITKTYKGGVEALKGVTFRVGWGEIFSYLGRNGSGKTTTLRASVGVLRPGPVLNRRARRYNGNAVARSRLGASKSC